MGYLALIERRWSQTKKGRDLSRLAAPLNESKGFYKNNKRNRSLSHSPGCGTQQFQPCFHLIQVSDFIFWAFSSTQDQKSDRRPSQFGRL
jgi:hypothetical protein